MAIRKIRELGDGLLRKKSREVTNVNERTATLIDDMLETMYDADGVGLAAPQVGVLKRIVVIDIGEGPLVFINPVIIKQEGEQKGQEGCLSVPGKAGIVTRPEYVRVRAFNENMDEFELDAYDLLARAICHETDHLDGIMYVDKVEGDLFVPENQD